MSSPCCPPGSLPALKTDYTPTGAQSEVDGTSLYVSKPEQASDVAVIAIPDIWGLQGGRHKAVCDSLASAGVNVVSFEPFGNDPWSKDEVTDEFGAWAAKTPFEKAAVKLHQAFDLAKQQGATKFHVIGFCWGVWAAFKALGDASFSAYNVQSLVGCHPSVQLEGVFGGDPVTVAGAVKVPTVHLMPAGNDPDMYREGGDVVKALRDAGSNVTITDFPEQVHGWVPRGDLANETTRAEVDKALQLAIAQFKA